MMMPGREVKMMILSAVRRAVDLDLRNASAGEAGLQLPLQVEVFDEQLAEIALREPA